MGDVAQLVERLVCNQKVVGSTPIVSMRKVEVVGDVPVTELRGCGSGVSGVVAGGWLRGVCWERVSARPSLAFGVFCLV